MKKLLIAAILLSSCSRQEDPKAIIIAKSSDTDKGYTFSAVLEDKPDTVTIAIDKNSYNNMHLGDTIIVWGAKQY